MAAVSRLDNLLYINHYLQYNYEKRLQYVTIHM
jgi:hypothetical protein